MLLYLFITHIIKMSENQMNQATWLDFLHLLHNKLRNSRGIKLTQMPALLEISNLMLFRFLDNANLNIKIPDELKFKHMYDKYASDSKIAEDRKIPKNVDRNCYKLWNHVYNTRNEEKCLILKYYELDELNPYLDSTTNRVSAFIKKHDACETIQDIVNTIYKKFENIEFNSNFYDMFGSAYEAFKTDASGNSGKNTAQHFTNQYIKKIVVDELKPLSNEIFYEPCAGSGGFIHTADHYVTANEGIKKSRIFKTNIHANECNPEIFRPLLLNMLFHNIPVQNIKEQDSLSASNVREMMEKADIIATNYPFGMSNKIESSEDEKWNEYWQVLRQSKSSFVKNSSAQFIIHIHHSLKPNGRVGFVSDRGILNNGADKANSWETKLREFMFAQNNIYRIVFLPQGAFTYTNFQTCIVFMKKGSITKKCELYHAVFKVPKDKSSAIVVEEKPLKIFTFEELKQNNFCVNIDEPKEELKEGWVKLGDICQISSGKFNSGDMDNAGQVPFYSCVAVNPVGKHSKYSFDFDEYILFVGSGGSQNNVCGPTIGMGKTYIVSGKTACRSNVFAMHNISYKLKYIYYVLQFIKYDICAHAKFSGNLGVISMAQIKEVNIPQLTIDHQNEIVEILDKHVSNYNLELLTPYTKSIDLFKLLIHKKYDVFADALHIIYRKIEADALDRKFELDKKAVFNMMMGLHKTKEHLLGDIVAVQIGSTPSRNKENYYGTGYMWCKCSDLKGGLITKTDEEITQDAVNNTGVRLISSGSIMVSFKLSIGKIGIASNDMYCNEAIMFFKHDNAITNTYLKNYFNYVDFSKGLLNGCIGGGSLNKSKLLNLNIPIPSIDDQQKIIDVIETIESNRSTYATYAQMLQQHIDTMETTIGNLCIVGQEVMCTSVGAQSNDDEQVEEIDSADRSDDIPTERPIVRKKIKPIVGKKKKVADDLDCSDDGLLEENDPVDCSNDIHVEAPIVGKKIKANKQIVKKNPSFDDHRESDGVQVVGKKLKANKQIIKKKLVVDDMDTAESDEIPRTDKKKKTVYRTTSKEPVKTQVVKKR